MYFTQLVIFLTPCYETILFLTANAGLHKKSLDEIKKVKDDLKRERDGLQKENEELKKEVLTYSIY